MENKPYQKFAGMLAISFGIMYAVMFLNVYRLEHVNLSLTRLYMTVLMVAPMAIVMMLFMPGMYTNVRMNRGIFVASASIFILSLVALRRQWGISDRQYMKAMIPHHSSAIMTSKSADLKDPEVRQLADSIIASQEREITEMKQILDRLSVQADK